MIDTYDSSHFKLLLLHSIHRITSVDSHLLVQVKEYNVLLDCASV